MSLPRPFYQSAVCLAALLLCGFGCEENASIVDAALESAPKPAAAPAPPPSSAAPTAGSASPIEARHGQGDAVRAAKTLKAIKTGALPLATPRWQAPKPLTFRTIRANYDYFQVNGRFLPDGLPQANGAAVMLSGAVMPLDKPPADGRLSRFWLASPKVVMAGCVFCNPPTLGDLVYVESTDEPLTVDREELYRGVVVVRLLGRFFIEHRRSPEGAEYLFRLEMKQVAE